MKSSQLFGQTLRDAPAEADIASHSLLMRAGFIRPLGAGIFTYLHLARRSMQKIEAILREEMDRIGGQEICMPVVQPADLWKETGRWYQIGPEMARFSDRNERDMVLAMTHEEVVADLVRREVQSYKHLPRLIYHIQTKFRDEPRPRAGLIRVREFAMKDSYSLDADWEGLDKQYQAHYQAYFNIYLRCGLPVIAVKSDTGMMGGKLAHEYMYLNPIGEDTLILCEACHYRANRQVARFQKTPAAPEEPKAIQKVYTPNCKSIEELANFLGVAKSKTAKAVFFMASMPPDPSEAQSNSGSTRELFIFAVIRGDMELNETKLANAIQARDLRPATEAEIKAVGAEPGFASPVGLKVHPSSCLVVVDDSIQAAPNLVAGANQSDYHLLNTNYTRDYSADIVADIAAAEAGNACPECGQPLRAARGVEVGNIFKLGTRYSDSLGCTFLDKDGKSKPVIMGSYGIGLGRLLACVAEEHHDEHGLIWPVTVAPYQVQLVLLRGKGTPQAEQIADKLYTDLQAAGIEVLYDDRDESPGVKFNDADLIGLPIRLTVSERALSQGGVEMKLRSQTEKVIVPQAELIGRIQAEIAALHATIASKVVPVEYTG
ncbi:MAG TPA: proline--tRNA ligase [Anaerolineales bacterium]|nr:proline--tRNA ligase [Anaerolineales bacterium]